MTKRLSFIAVGLCALAMPTGAWANDEPDELVPGKVMVVKPGKLAKFVAKPTSGDFVMPGATNDPTVEGATLRIFDTQPGGAGDVTYTLPASGWSALGNPPGSKGYKYKGKDAVPLDSTCKVVLLKPSVMKAVCKGAAVTFTTPFLGDAGIILTAGTDSKRYCLQYGGEEKKNTTILTKRKNAPAPGSCPALGATPTVTQTPLSTNTATPTGTAAATIAATPTATPTHTAGPACPIAAGAYTITQGSGGTLAVSIFPAFPFPSGGTILQDVAAGDSNCVHDTVVPMGGFNAPIFCIPSLGLYTEIQQTGCGVGRIDSDGGSDFTVLEQGDTSDSSPTCNLPHLGCTNGADSSIRVDVTVGNGAADTCGSGGTANAIVAVPVYTRTWSDGSGGSAIPPCSGDGVYQPGTDSIITEFPQILDFTTDTTAAAFVDLDGDGCSEAGLEGPGGKNGTGVCLDIGAGTITTAASGTIGSAGAPTYDLTFSSTLINTIAGPAAPLGATCPSPPIINFTGPATRCIP